ncbi:hypothetical protein RRG08_026802 [Elysia crispata]|uniref:Uncharacterized protein n=1 Tax=Elysia crispata TaxID=231223 RepID=A0AAE1APZ0_9GAST|nr:hypothetical protein RRG08_026802 [Elysia crispata]
MLGLESYRPQVVDWCRSRVSPSPLTISYRVDRLSIGFTLDTGTWNIQTSPINLTAMCAALSRIVSRSDNG